MANIYYEQFSGVARTAFSMWNRDPASPSFGSFDRQYWGWKYKDFSDATMQYAARLAIEYAKKKEAVACLPELIEGYIGFCSTIQLPDGSFNQCYPYERSPGVLYDFLSTLIYVHQSPFLSSERHRKKLANIIERGAAFVIRTDERHGEVTNHIAQYTYELLNYAQFSGNQSARQKGMEYLERALAWFNRSEGWFLEYHGPDTGYQTRTLRYLVKIAQLLDSNELWEVIRRATVFVADTLMPDGSVHPMLGSRSTALLYPSAFEILGSMDSAFGELALRVRSAWAEERVPLPTELDFGNAIRLADDALDASNACESSSHQFSQICPALAAKEVHYPDAGIIIIREENRGLYIGYKLGGIVVIYTRGRDGRWKLVYEDSGYLLESGEPACSRWLTRMPGSGTMVQHSDKCFRITARFFRSLHDELTPERMLLLRFLNLTVLRFQFVADLFRKIVVRHLMSERVTLPLMLRREVAIRPDTVEITDLIESPAGLKASTFGSMYRARRVTGTHMATSRYFQEQELEQLSIGWVTKMTWPEGAGQPNAVSVKTGVAT